MTLAAKVRAFEKRMAEVQALTRIEDAARVLILRDEVLWSISTAAGTPLMRGHLAVATYRVPSDTDESLSSRHESEVRESALKGSPSALNAIGKARPA